MGIQHIPLHEFSYHPDRRLPFAIGRLDQLPPEAQASYPNRHTFYEIFWITGGIGNHVIDFVTYPLQPRNLFFIAPGQVHFWQLRSPAIGYAILLPAEFFRVGLSINPILDELTLFRPEEAPPMLKVGETDAEAIEHLVDELVAEYTAPQFAQVTVLQALVQLLLVRAQRLLLASTPPEPPGAAAGLTRRFLRLVEERYADTHAVAAYADALGVTAGHLTDTVRATLGRPAGTVVRERLILEAKRLLVHADVSIATIAHELNFGDPSYFGRVFRQVTGQSPQVFRAEFRKMYQPSRDSSLV